MRENFCLVFAYKNQCLFYTFCVTQTHTHSGGMAKWGPKGPYLVADTQ